MRAALSARRRIHKGVSIEINGVLHFCIHLYGIVARVHVVYNEWLFEGGLIHFFTPSTPVGIRVYKNESGFGFIGFYGFFPRHPIDLVLGESRNAN